MAGIPTRYFFSNRVTLTRSSPVLQVTRRQGITNSNSNAPAVASLNGLSQYSPGEGLLHAYGDLNFFLGTS